MPTDVNAGKTVPPDKAMVNTGWVAPTINDWSNVMKRGIEGCERGN
jgi:hypothetical protein